MSRSRKKYPFCKCEKSCKKGKKIANHKIRNLSKMNEEIPNGKAYKKFFCSWDICDYCHSCTYKEYLLWLKAWNYDLTDNDYIDWYKTYKRK